MTTETPVKQSGDPGFSTESTRSGPVYRPNVDIIEQQDQLVIYADLPGVTEEMIDVNFQDGMLTIHGKVNPRQSDGTQYLTHEYGVGDFYRTFRVSEKIDASKIAADYRDGVLVLRLPKSESHKPRKIAVQSN